MWWLLTLLLCAARAHAHGRVLQPPSRASAWRFGFNTPANYDDDGVNCGGFYYQWSVNGGKCGICGDAYDLRVPRPHELGGRYGVGLIVDRYLPGSTLATTVDITTSHRGSWQFKLCPDPHDNSQECFDRHVLELEDGGTVYYPRKGSKKYYVNYRLPPGLVCDHCVLQWRYTAGNNWGECKNGTQALGCGNQEEFGACSDISIGVSSGNSIDDSSDDYGNLPSPLLYFLKHGHFDSQQGVLNLIRDNVHPRPKKRRVNSKFTRRKKKGKKKRKPRKRKKFGLVLRRNIL